MNTPNSNIPAATFGQFFQVRNFFDACLSAEVLEKFKEVNNDRPSSLSARIPGLPERECYVHSIGHRHGFSAHLGFWSTYGGVKAGLLLTIDPKSVVHEGIALSFSFSGFESAKSYYTHIPGRWARLEKAEQLSAFLEKPRPEVAVQAFFLQILYKLKEVYETDTNIYMTMRSNSSVERF